MVGLCSIIAHVPNSYSCTYIYILTIIKALYINILTQEHVSSNTDRDSFRHTFPVPVPVQYWEVVAERLSVFAGLLMAGVQEL